VTTNLHRERERESNGLVSSSPKILILVFLELGLHFFSSYFCVWQLRKSESLQTESLKL